jgi:hypothetical protein
MAILDLRNSGELRLVLRGADENVILNTLRNWPHWLRVEVERDPADSDRYRSVTLITGRNQEETIREVLRRGFRMRFPPEGGEQTLNANPAVAQAGSRRSVR